MWWWRNKSNGLHDKGCYHKGQYKVTFLYIKSLHIQKSKAHDNLCFPLWRAYLLLFYIYFSVFTFMQESLMFIPIPLYLFFSWQALCGRERSRNIYPVECRWSWVIIVDIIPEINKLGGKTLSPYLPMCLTETVCSKNMLWVSAIMED